MRISVTHLVATGVCLAVLAGGVLADEPLQVGETAVEHLGTGESRSDSAETFIHSTKTNSFR